MGEIDVLLRDLKKHGNAGRDCALAAEDALTIAAAIEAAREDAANAARWRLCTSEHQIEGDEVIKCHVNVGVNVWHGAEWCAFYECSPDELQAAIDQARGKENGNG